MNLKETFGKKGAKTIKNGIWREHPISSATLGICSALAISNKVENAIAMSAGVIFVLILTAVIISLLRKIIPSRVRIIHKKHPICRGLPADFTLEVTEMYDEPFGVPEPDTLLFTEHWAAGEFFRSGCLWSLGEGKVFYFRPGDQAYPLYKNEHIIKILENACLWLGSAD